MDQEDRFYDFAQLGALHEDDKAVILCDRGVYDNTAYIDSESWQAVLDE